MSSASRHAGFKLLWILIWVAAALLLRPSIGRGQAPQLSGDVPQHRATAMAGWDPTIVLELGYGTLVSDFMGAHDASFDLAVALPAMLQTELGGIKATVGFSTVAVSESGLGLELTARSGLAWAYSATGRKIGWVVESALRPGYYGALGAITFELGWRAALATHITHADPVRALFADRYPLAPDPGGGPSTDWYGLSAQRYRLGLSGGTQLGDAGLLGSLGFEYSPQEQGLLTGPPLLKMPFYVLLGGDYRW